MGHPFNRQWILALSVCFGMAILGVFLVGRDLSPSKAAAPQPIDAASLEPGKELPLIIGSYDVRVFVPPDEGFTYGTLGIDIPSLGY